MLRMNSKPGGRHQGFTLVEILVVCGVVALLSSLLLSAFGQVRGRARNTACANNLKQIGLAIQMYASDHVGRYPNKKYAFNNPRCAWADILLPYTRTTKVFLCPASRNTPYVPGCGPDGSTETEELDDYRGGVNYDGSYDMNVLSNTRFISEANFKHPATTVSVLDGNGRLVWPSNDVPIDIENDVPAVKRPRHRNGNNVLFLDGHVKFLTSDALKDPALWKFR